MESLIRKNKKIFQWEMDYLAVKYLFEDYSDGEYTKIMRRQ